MASFLGGMVETLVIRINYTNSPMRATSLREILIPPQLQDIAGLNSALTGVNISLAATQSIGNSYTSTLILLTFPQQSGVPSPEDMQTLESDLLQLRERFDVGGAALLNSSGTKLGYRGFYRAGELLVFLSW